MHHVSTASHSLLYVKAVSSGVGAREGLHFFVFHYHNFMVTSLFKDTYLAMFTNIRLV